ncbi:MAG: putative ABC transporter permease [Oscillospiraceae bacterium]|nr:putative ABC transporter permease [Oscillospiraceae bacterium]
MAQLFWYFLFYSFMGFLLEQLYAAVTHAPNQARKCFLFLPLCPVYGFGALAILILPQAVRAHPVALFLYGAMSATAVEYAVDFLYDKVCRVRFWDYTGLPANLNGRVCLLFSFFWGCLSLPLCYLAHPLVERIAPPLPLLMPVACLLLADGIVTAALLRRHRTTAVLCWRRWETQKRV